MIAIRKIVGGWLNASGLNGMSVNVCDTNVNWLTNTNDSNNAMKVTIKVSPRNCTTRLFRVLPNVFLIPTSFALRMAWALARFVKLIQAMTRIKTPIILNVLITSGEIVRLLKLSLIKWMSCSGIALNALYFSACSFPNLLSIKLLNLGLSAAGSAPSFSST
jgi:hypothetical protein